MQLIRKKNVCKNLKQKNKLKQTYYKILQKYIIKSKQCITNDKNK